MSPAPKRSGLDDRDGLAETSDFPRVGKACKQMQARTQFLREQAARSSRKGTSQIRHWRFPQLVRNAPKGQGEAPTRSGDSPHRVRQTPPRGQEHCHRPLNLHHNSALNLNL